MKKFHISVTSDNINARSAILDLNEESIWKQMKFLAGDKKYWIWGKARELSIGSLENNAGNWWNMMIVYKHLNVSVLKISLIFNVWSSDKLTWQKNY